VLLGPIAQQKPPAPAADPEQRAAPVLPVPAQADDTDTTMPAEPDVRAPAPPLAPSPPNCIHFHGGPQTIRQIRKARHENSPLNYCVVPTDIHLFDAAMTTAMHDERGRDLWLVFHPVHHSIAMALRQLPVHKFSGLEQRDSTDALHPSTPLGNSAVITPLTIALLGDTEQERHVIPNVAGLSSNSFRLLSHTDLGGTERVFVAYFSNRETGRNPGVAAGFLEILSDARGRVAIDDPVGGMQFTAASLSELVERLQDLTGCRYLPINAADSEDSLEQELVVQTQAARSLFVAREETLSATAPHPYLDYNQNQDFFDAIAVTLDGRPGLHLLYRNSFTRCGNTLFYVDALGESGRLDIRPSAEPGQPGTLHCPRWADLAMAQSAGLEVGGAYTVQQISDAMRGANMLFLPTAPTLVTAEASTGKDRETSRMPLRLPGDHTFDEASASLHYVDAMGKLECLRFHRVDTETGVARYQLIDTAPSPTQDPTVRNRFSIGWFYSKADILWNMRVIAQDHDEDRPEQPDPMG